MRNVLFSAADSSQKSTRVRKWKNIVKNRAKIDFKMVLKFRKNNEIEIEKRERILAYTQILSSQKLIQAQIRSIYVKKDLDRN